MHQVDPQKIKIEEIRKNIRETNEKELIREALRARTFSGISTMRQGMDLIDFALRIKRTQHEKD